MDYLDPDVRKKHTRLLFIGYGLMAILIGVATTLFVLFTLGFAFDRSTGTIIQNGLAFIDTNPVAADVYVNDEIRGRGDQRLVLPAGDYRVSIREDGYREWNTEFFLSGGTVRRFSYPFLIAEELVESTYRRFTTSPSFISTSPDRKWLILQESSRVDAFVVYDLSQGVNLPSFFTLPVGIFTPNVTNSSLEVIEWSNDNQHVIIKHTFEEGFEYILLNREDPASSQNLTSRFADIPFTTISLINKQFDQYHLFNANESVLYEAALEEDEVTMVLENVVTYRSHGSDTLLFVQAETPIEATDNSEPINASTATVRQLSNDQIIDIHEIEFYESTSAYLLDIARLDGDWYVVMGTSDSGQVVIYKNPVESRQATPNRELVPVVTLRTEHPPKAVSFSANARNIMLQSDRDVAVFDAEEDEVYRFLAGDETTNRQSFWMDGHRIIFNEQGVAYMIDFTGDNRQKLVPCKPRYRPVFDSSYAFMYCVHDDEEADGGALVRVSLRASSSELR